MHIFEGKERRDLDLHFHQSISPLSEGKSLDLDLEVPFVEFFFVLPLFSPISISCFWRDLVVKDFSTSSVLAFAFVHRFALSTRICGSERL